MKPPKEKAEELIRKFTPHSRMYPELVNENGPVFRLTNDSKECALILVDEIIQQNNIWIKQVKKGTNNYWIEVKQEIENYDN